MKKTTRIPTHGPSRVIRHFLSLKPLVGIMLLVVASLFAVSVAQAQTTFTDSSDLQTFVSSGQPTGSFGGGAVEIAAATTAQPAIEEALFSFNTESLVYQLNQAFPTGWTITSLSVTLNSNYATAGTQPGNSSFNVINPGLFQLSWLSNNGWQSGVSYNTIANYLPGTGNSNQELSLGTYNYLADGTTPLTWALSATSAAGLLAELTTGGEVTIFGTPDSSTVGYLFNTSTKGDPPILNVTAEAAPAPIPPSFLLFGTGIVGLGLVRRRITL